MNRSVGRIIALDPVGFLLNDIVYSDQFSRLSRGDAQLVEAHHTSSIFGLEESVAHIDIYYNPIGGYRYIQPGCTLGSVASSEIYSHSRAREYFYEWLKMIQSNSLDNPIMAFRAANYSNFLSGGVVYDRCVQKRSLCKIPIDLMMGVDEYRSLLKIDYNLDVTNYDHNSYYMRTLQVPPYLGYHSFVKAIIDTDCSFKDRMVDISVATKFGLDKFGTAKIKNSYFIDLGRAANWPDLEVSKQ